MKRWWSRALLVLLGTVFSCEKREVIPDMPEPRLRSITVSLPTVVLPEDGSFELPFTVKDPDYPFNTIRLQASDGKTPKEFSMKEVLPGKEQGSYLAVLTDAGTGEVYEQEVCLIIVVKNAETGQESYFSSPYFVIKSERQHTGPAVKTGLPVVYVDTQNGQAVTSKTEFVQARLSILGRGDYPSLETVSCSIRGRGNTTWTWPKKPYLLKLDEKASIFGMHKHKRWVLLANFMDRTLMRNLVSMKVSNLTSLAWTPGCVPVELILNGVHMGSYLLIEQVRVDNHRVAITEMTPQDNTGDAVTGGYLLELDFHYDNEFQWKEQNIPFAVKYPDPEDLSSQQKTYIKNYIKEVSNAIYGANFKDPEKGYAKYLDVDSFIDYWIVYEVMCNHELGNPGSVYFHKDRNGKLTAGPCWDFDWGVLSFKTSAGETRLVNGKAIWYARLFQDPAFKSRVLARFLELLPQLETIPDYMDECESWLAKSAELNFAMWDPSEDRSQNGGQIINGDENLSFHDAVARLKKNYKKHLQVIQASL